MPYPPISFCLAMAVITAALVLLGMWMRNRGMIPSRALALAWALLCGLPLLLSMINTYSANGRPPVHRAGITAHLV